MKNNLVLKIVIGALIVAVAGLVVKLAMTKPTVQTNVVETTTTATIPPTTVTSAATTQPIAKATTTTTKTAIKSKTAPLTIGANYGGGKVAYILQSGDPGYVAGQQHGLIATVADQSTGATWGCNETVISGADGTALGTGNQNTIDIMAGCSETGIAARLCGDLVEGGYNEWYLPSKDELNKLYLNHVAIGYFAATSYWSSSQNGGRNFAWSQNFSNGSHSSDYKSNTTSYVRCVRGF